MPRMQDRSHSVCTQCQIRTSCHSYRWTLLLICKFLVFSVVKNPILQFKMHWVETLLWTSKLLDENEKYRIWNIWMNDQYAGARMRINWRQYPIFPLEVSLNHVHPRNDHPFKRSKFDIFQFYQIVGRTQYLPTSPRTDVLCSWVPSLLFLSDLPFFRLVDTFCVASSAASSFKLNEVTVLPYSQIKGIPISVTDWSPS